MNHAPYAPPRVGAIPPGREQSNQRLNELLEQIRAEFDAQAQRSGDFDRESESCRPPCCTSFC